MGCGSFKSSLILVNGSQNKVNQPKKAKTQLFRRDKSELQNVTDMTEISVNTEVTSFLTLMLKMLTKNAATQNFQILTLLIHNNKVGH